MPALKRGRPPKKHPKTAQNPTGAGRTSKKTPERIERLLNALKQGCTRGKACIWAGISEDTLANWLKSDSEFSENVEKAELAFEMSLVGTIRKASIDSWQAAAWLLERRRSSTYSRYAPLKETTPADKELMFEVVDDK